MPLHRQTIRNQRIVYRCRFSCRSLKPGVGCEHETAWADSNSLAVGLSCLLVPQSGQLQKQGWLPLQFWILMEGIKR